jgi:hypothetical protein
MATLKGFKARDMRGIRLCTGIFLVAHFLTKRVLNMDAVTHPMKHLWQLQGFKAQDIGGIRLCSILMMLCK